MDYPGQVNIPGLRRTFEESLYLDDVLLQFGDDDDAAIVLNSAGLDPDEELTSVIIGSSDHPGTAANSLIIGNETADGDIMLAVQSGGNTTMSLLLDASAETLVLHGLDTIAFANAGTISYPNDTAAALTLQSADGSTQMTFSSVNSGHHQADGININTPNVTLTDNANARYRTINGSVVTVTLAGTTQVTLQQNFNSFGAVTLAQTGGAVTMDDAAHLLASVPGANTSVTLTKAVGLRVADAATTAGTVTSAYGIYVDAIASGDTNDYAIYTNAGTVRFGDDVSLDGDLDFTGPQEISTSTGDLTLAPATGTVLVNVGTGTELGSTILLLDASSATGQTSSTDETTLYTYTLPANTLVNVHDSVFYHAGGTFAADGNNKTLTAYFGATTLGTTGAQAYNGVAWDVSVMAYMSFAGNQRILTTISVNGVVQDIEYDSPAGVNDETGAIVLAIKGTAANATAGQIVKRTAYTEFRGMP